MLFGAVPVFVGAQVVADQNAGAYRPTVIQTQNGIQQVNITAPSGAGVSVNHYTRFDAIADSSQAGSNRFHRA